MHDICNLGRYYRFVLLLLLLLITASCNQSSTKPPTGTEQTPSAAGTWGDPYSSFAACGTSGQLGVYFEFEQSARSNSVTGNVALVSDENQAIGHFNGNISSSGSLSGSATFSDSVMNVSLKVSASNIKGTLVTREYFECRNGSQDKITLTVDMQKIDTPAPPNPGTPDSFEPNNSLEQAASITLDFEANLTLLDNDADWFKFTLPEAQDISMTVKGSDAANE
jgi:hypothetical protein